MRNSLELTTKCVSCINAKRRHRLSNKGGHDRVRADECIKHLCSHVHTGDLITANSKSFLSNRLETPSSAPPTCPTHPLLLLCEPEEEHWWHHLIISNYFEVGHFICINVYKLSLALEKDCNSGRKQILWTEQSKTINNVPDTHSLIDVLYLICFMNMKPECEKH